MIMKNFLIALTLVLSLLVSGLSLMPATVMADARDDVCKGVELTGGSCDPTPGQPTVNSIIKDVVNILSFVVGVVAVIMVIVGGLKYITSGGDSNSVNSAKNTILYAVIGLVVVALAQIIVRFVLTRIQK